MALPKPPEDEGGGQFNDFLKPSHIGKIGATATVIAQGARDEIVRGQFGDQIMVEIKHGKKQYDFAVKIDSPNYRMLYARFGPKAAKWKGKIALEVRAPIRKGYQPFIGVVQDR